MGRGVVQFPTEAPDDGDAVLMVSAPREGLPRKPARTGRGVVQMPAEVPDDGDAMILASSRNPPAPRAAPMPAAAAPVAAPEPDPPVAEATPESGAEFLPSRPTAVRDADKVMKHDLSIWDPRARLQQVKQAAKANSFDTTAAQGPASAWLRGLKKG